MFDDRSRVNRAYRAYAPQTLSQCSPLRGAGGRRGGAHTLANKFVTRNIAFRFASARAGVWLVQIKPETRIASRTMEGSFRDLNPA